MSPFFNDLPTLHDGGSQTTPVTHFVARALLEENQETSVGILKLLSDGGMAEISQHRFKADIDDAFEAAKDMPGPDIFVAATGQMARWMGSISKSATGISRPESLSSFATTRTARKLTIGA